MALTKTESKKTGKSKKQSKSPGIKKATQFGKRVSYKAKFEEAQAKHAQCQDRLLRTLAEFDNMKKRSERDRAQLIDAANSGLILKILPVVDDLERSLKTEHQGDELRQGVELILKKLVRTLEDEGVKPIESIGQPFDVDYHDALLQMERKDTEPGIILEEHEKGYCLNDKVLRHARVIVSK